MNCYCSSKTTPVMGVGAWFSPSRVRGVGDFDWGTLAQDVVKSGLQIGVAYAGSELGTTSKPSASTGITSALPSPYTGAGLASATQPAASTSSGVPTWVWPVVIGGGAIAVLLVLKSR